MTAVAEQIAVDFARQRRVVAELRRFLPEPAILFDHEDVKPYECDGLTA
jgi:glycolate oxidase